MAQGRLPETPESFFRRLIEDERQSGYIANLQYLDPNLYHDDAESELKESERICFEFRIPVHPSKDNLKKAAHAIADVVFNPAQPYTLKFKCLSVNGKSAKGQGWFSTSKEMIYSFKDKDNRGNEICITVSRKVDQSGYYYDAETYKAILLEIWKKLIEKKVEGIGYIFPILENLPLPAEFGITTPFSYTCFSLMHPQYGRLRRSTENFNIERDLGAGIKITCEDLKRAGISLADVNEVIQSRLKYVPKHQVVMSSALSKELSQIKATCEAQPASFIVKNELNLKFLTLQAKNFPKDPTIEFLYELEMRFLHNEDARLSLPQKLENAVQLFSRMNVSKQYMADDVETFVNLIRQFLDEVFLNLSQAQKFLLHLYELDLVRLAFSDGDLSSPVNPRVEDLMHKATYSSAYSMQLINRRLIILDAEKKVLNTFSKDEAAAKKMALAVKNEVIQQGRWKYPRGIKNIMGFISEAEQNKLGWCLAAFMIQVECRARPAIPKLFRDGETLGFYQRYQNLLEGFSNIRVHFEREPAVDVAEFLAMPAAPATLLDVNAPSLDPKPVGEHKSVPPPNAM